MLKIRYTVKMKSQGPAVGDKAPDFTLPEASDQMISLSDELKKGTVILIFYPTDFGITCTLEFKTFQKMLDEFKKAGASLVGISVSSTRSHRAWKENIGISFPLLSDADTKVARMYDVMNPEDNLLKGHSTRAIFIVDRKGIVRYRWVPEDLHVQPDYELLVKKSQEINT